MEEERLSEKEAIERKVDKALQEMRERIVEIIKKVQEEEEKCQKISMLKD